MDDEFEDSARTNIPISRNRSFIKSENETFFPNTARTTISDNGFPKFNLNESDKIFQRRSRSSRLNESDELEYETQNLTLKHTTSSDSLTSRGSRNFSRHSPLGSFRSIRDATRAESDKNGINIIMVVGFAIVLAIGYIFSKIEVFLKWFQFKLNEIQSHLFGGKSLRDYYAQEESFAKKLLYSPLSGLCFVFQTLVYVFLRTFEVLKKPAPKKLVTNVFSRYLKE